MVKRATKPKRTTKSEQSTAVEIIPPDRQRRPGTFQPGHKVNANNNMPRGRFITAQLVRLMHETIDDPEWDPENKERVRVRAKAIYFFCRKLMTMALEGDTTALKMVMDRIEGTPISTTIFKPSDDPEHLTSDQAEALSITQQKLAAMTPEARMALYNSTLSEGSGVQGSA